MLSQVISFSGSYAKKCDCHFFGVRTPLVAFLGTYESLSFSSDSVSSVVLCKNAVIVIVVDAKSSTDLGAAMLFLSK